jgi:hypothetical protein
MSCHLFRRSIQMHHSWACCFLVVGDTEASSLLRFSSPEREPRLPASRVVPRVPGRSPHLELLNLIVFAVEYEFHETSHLFSTSRTIYPRSTKTVNSSKPRLLREDPCRHYDLPHGGLLFSQSARRSVAKAAGFKLFSFSVPMSDAYFSASGDAGSNCTIRPGQVGRLAGLDAQITALAGSGLMPHRE